MKSQLCGTLVCTYVYNALLQTGETLLHGCAVFGYYELLKELVIRYNLDINQPNHVSAKATFYHHRHHRNHHHQSSINSHFISSQAWSSSLPSLSIFLQKSS